MIEKNRFNLIDEPWIPVVDVGRASLRQIFSYPEYRALGGNPIQKIAITKLLLAIAQAAATPKDDEAWSAMGADGMARACLDYLERWHDRFWLYGERPFLQYPKLNGSRLLSYGAVLPEIATGNTTVLTELQAEKPLPDEDRALLLITQMGFALGGKKTDNSIVLTSGYAAKTKPNGKPASGRHGVSIGYMGYLHSFLQTTTLLKSLWLNVFDRQQIDAMDFYPEGLGIASWEEMPAGEDCPVARRLRDSLMGKLVPLSRFCLLKEEGLHYTEGTVYATYKEGGIDPSVAVSHAGKTPKTLWVDAEKRPWRQLTALLSFMGQMGNSRFDCYQLSLGLTRARRHEETIGVWSGGLRVSSNAGEQYVSGKDDFVESVVLLDSNALGEQWYVLLNQEMGGLEKIANRLYGATLNYYKQQKLKVEVAGDYAAMSRNLFWQLAERFFQQLVDACDADDEAVNLRQDLRKKFSGLVVGSFDNFCPHDTARQLEAWAKCRPNLADYQNQGEQT